MKRKKRSCALCKPHKTGGAVRWKEKELAALKDFEYLTHRFARISE